MLFFLLLFCKEKVSRYGNLYGQTLATEVAGCALEGLLQDLGSVAQEAAQEMGPGRRRWDRGQARMKWPLML